MAMYNDSRKTSSLRRSYLGKQYAIPTSIPASQTLRRNRKAETFLVLVQSPVRSENTPNPHVIVGINHAGPENLHAKLAGISKTT